MGKVRKMTVIPFEEQEEEEPQSSQSECTQQIGHGQEGGNEKVKSVSIRERANLKLINLLRVMSKLASIQGYDEEGRIQSRSGGYMNNTDIAFLLQNSMAPGKLIVGQDEFIHLLIKAKVNPDLILNENVRSKLLNENSNMHSQDLNFSNKIKEVVQARNTELPKNYLDSPESPINASVVENNKLLNSKRRFDEVYDSENNDNESTDSLPMKKRKNELPRKWIVPEEL